MVNIEQYLALIDLIYNAVLSPENWTSVLSGVQDALSGCGALLGIDVAGQPRLLEVTGYDDSAIQSFETIYAAKSFVWGLLPRARQGDLIHDRVVLPPEQRLHDVFANEWARTYDTTDCVVRSLVKRDRASAFCIIARSPGCGPFEAEALALERCATKQKLGRGSAIE